MTSRPSHRTFGPHQALIEAYLADLERALYDLDPAERDDVVAPVREHIDAAMSEYGLEPTEHEVEELLGQLGSVDQIARDASDGADRSGRDALDTGAGDGWISVVLASLSLVLFWFPLVAVPLALGAGIAAAIRMRSARGPAGRRYRIAIALSARSSRAPLPHRYRAQRRHDPDRRAPQLGPRRGERSIEPERRRDRAADGDRASPHRMIRPSLQQHQMPKQRR
jgi:hypothetical protein